MQRYRLTKSGVCDCMIPDESGPWVKHEEIAKTIQQARRASWEQCKKDIIAEWEKPYGLTDGSQFIARLRAMEYKEKVND